MDFLREFYQMRESRQNAQEGEWRPAAVLVLDPMARQTVDSAALESVDYDRQSQDLDIELTTGRIYRYFDVPPGVYEALMDADSKGRFYNDHIRDVYLCRRLR